MAHGRRTGSVLLDGLDVRALDSDWLRENVAVVHQEPILLGMNIAQNIAYALDSATQAQVCWPACPSPAFPSPASPSSAPQVPA